MIKKIALVFSMFIFVFLLTSCGDRDVEVQWMDLSCNPSDIEIGQFVDIQINFIPHDADDQGYYITIDDPNIADFRNNDTQIEGLAAGTVWVQIRTHDDNYYDSCVIHVYDPSP